MTAYIFPGQGAQFPGMGQDLFSNYPIAKGYYEKANEILGFSISDIMFEGTEEELKQTKVTQPAIFLHSVIAAEALSKAYPDMVAGHSLGEFSALVASQAIAFEDGLRLVQARANAMQEACEATEGTMAAVLGLEDAKVEQICNEISEVVVAANYNCPGQLVISGSMAGIDLACEQMTEAGAKRAIKLPVGGAFHSPLMEPAREALAGAIEDVRVNQPICPIYQNATAQATEDPDTIKANLIAQLTAPVRWTQSIQGMVASGATEFVELGPGKVLGGLMRKIHRESTYTKLEVEQAS